MNKQRNKKIGGVLLLIALFVIVTFQVLNVFADPTGAVISGATTTSGPTVEIQSQANARGTITTMLLTANQQNSHWKGYVGNVTGLYVLDNALNFTLYSWDLAAITGQVYATRYNNVSWSNITCAYNETVDAESLFHNMTGSTDEVDDINSTFNWSIHKAFNIANITIDADTCNFTTVTYANDTRQVPTAGAPYQEVMLMDSLWNYTIFMTDIGDDVQGYDNETNDFQIIVPESDVKASPTTYYFYVELR